MSATLAPRIEIYTLIVCSVLKREMSPSTSPGAAILSYSHSHLWNLSFFTPIVSTPGNDLSGPISHGLVYTTSFYNNIEEGSCAADPVVQAEVAKLAAGRFDFMFCFKYRTFVQTVYFSRLEVFTAQISVRVWLHEANMRLQPIPRRWES